MIEEAKVKAWCLVNGDVKMMEFPLESLLIDKDGLRYFVDDYGMGAVRWSVINTPKEAYKRQLQDNVKWAKERLIWAKEHAKSEIDELQTVIDSNGWSRFPSLLENLKKIAAL